MSNFSIIAKLGLDSTKMTGGLKSVTTKVKALGTTFSTKLKGGIAMAGAAMIKFGVDGLAAFTSFSSGMSEVRTLLPQITDANFDKLKDSVRSLSTTFGTDLQDNVEALYQTLSKGVPPENAIAFLTSSSKLAITAAGSAEEATNALATVINSYGMEATEADRISKLMFGTIAAGSTTLEEYAPQIGNLVPLAASLGVSFEEVSAQIVSMTSKMGGNTPKVMTQISALYIEMAKEGTKASTAFKEMAGISFTDFLSQGGTVEEAMKKMAEKAKDVEGGFLGMFSSAEAAKAAITLMSENGLSLADSMELLKTKANGFDDAFEMMMTDVGRQWDILVKGGEDAMLSLGEAMTPIIEDTVPTLTKSLTSLGKLFGGAAKGSDEFKNSTSALSNIISGTTKVVGVIFSGLGGLVDIIVLAAKQTGAFVGVFALMGKTAFRPIIPIIDAVIDTFSALATLMANPFDPAAQKKAWKEVREAGAKAGEAVGMWGEDFSNAWNDASHVFEKNNKEFVDGMEVRSNKLHDFWNDTGEFADKAEGEVIDLEAGLRGAAGQAGKMAGALATMPWNLKQAKNVIDRHLVKALGRGLDAANPLALKMDEIQADSKDIATFWADAAKSFGQVAKGDMKLAIKGWKGIAVRAGVIARDMGAAEAKMRGGFGQVAALAPEALQAVKDASEISVKGGRVLQVMLENAQRAGDMTREGLLGLDAEIDAIEKGAREADVPIQALAKDQKLYYDWLVKRREIAEENLKLLLEQIDAQGKLAAKTQEVQSLLGSLADEMAKREPDKEFIYKLREQLKALGVDIAAELGLVRDEASKLGVPVEQVDALQDAAKALREIADLEVEPETYLVTINDSLISIDRQMGSLISAVNNIKIPEGGGGDGDGDKGNTETHEHNITVNVEGAGGGGDDDLPPLPAIPKPDDDKDDDDKKPDDKENTETHHHEITVNVEGAGGDGDEDLPPLPEPDSDSTEVTLPSPSDGDTTDGEVVLPDPASGDATDGEVTLPDPASGDATDGEVILPDPASGDGTDGDVDLPTPSDGDDVGDVDLPLPPDDSEGTALSLEATQKEVLSTLKGYFVNQ